MSGGNGITGAMPVVYRGFGVINFALIVFDRQEVKPMNAVSAMGSPQKSTIARPR